MDIGYNQTSPDNPMFCSAKVSPNPFNAHVVNRGTKCFLERSRSRFTKQIHNADTCKIAGTRKSQFVVNFLCFSSKNK